MSPLRSKPQFRVRTLCQRNLVFPFNEDWTVSDLKEEICKGKDIFPHEVMLVSGGAECLDIDQAPCLSCVMLRTSASRIVEIVVKVTGDLNKKNETFSLCLPLNTRVNAVKSLLIKQNMTKWTVTGQRLISSSVLMKDHQILGDFLIHQKSHTKSSAVSPLVLYLSQTIDAKAEMEFLVKLRNKQEIKFFFEFGIPVYYAKEILRNQFGIVKDVDYCFVDEKSGRQLSDMNKSLLDYGYLPNHSGGNKLTVVLAMPPAPMPTLPPGVAIFDIKGLPLTSGMVASSATNKRKRGQYPSKLSISTESSCGTDEKKSPSPESTILFSSATLKKKPSGKKSPTCGMFGGMKKGFLSSKFHRKNN